MTYLVCKNTMGKPCGKRTLPGRWDCGCGWGLLCSVHDGKPDILTMTFSQVALEMSDPRCLRYSALYDRYIALAADAELARQITARKAFPEAGK